MTTLFSAEKCKLNRKLLNIWLDSVQICRGFEFIADSVDLGSNLVVELRNILCYNENKIPIDVMEKIMAEYSFNHHISRNPHLSETETLKDVENLYIQ